MNVIFLTSRTAHHYYLINELNKCQPVKKVFFETRHTQRRAWLERFKRWQKLKNIRASFRGIANRILFGRENTLEETYERERFFQGLEPFLDPSIPFEEVFSFNNPGVVELVKQQEPDLIIVFGTEILKGEILHIAKLDILNIHRGILPKYRGGSVDAWAFYNKDFKNLGVTIHVCTDTLDGGDIVGQKFYQLKKDDEIYSLRYKTTMFALELLRNILSGYQNDNIRYRAQEQAKLWMSKDMTIAKRLIARRNFFQHIKAL